MRLMKGYSHAALPRPYIGTLLHVTGSQAAGLRLPAVALRTGTVALWHVERLPYMRLETQSPSVSVSVLVHAAGAPSLASITAKGDTA